MRSYRRGLVRPAVQKFLAGRRGRTHLWFRSGLMCSQTRYSPHQSSSALTQHSLCGERESHVATLHLKGFPSHYQGIKTHFILSPLKLRLIKTLSHEGNTRNKPLTECSLSTDDNWQPGQINWSTKVITINKSTVTVDIWDIYVG